MPEMRCARTKKNVGSYMGGDNRAGHMGDRLFFREPEHRHVWCSKRKARAFS